MGVAPVAAGQPPAPAHIAIIMDGNGRWAAGRGLPRAAGHRAGAQAVRRTIEAAAGAGVGWLTLYAFSSENWRRPADEVLELTGLLRHYIRQELNEITREGVRVRIIGDRDRFDALLTDITIPGSIDGIGLAEHAREVHPNLPVLFVSGRPANQHRAAAITQPMAYMQKPFETRTLLCAMRRLIEGNAS